MAREAFLLFVIAALAVVSLWAQSSKARPDAVPEVVTVTPEAPRAARADAAVPATVGRDLQKAAPDHSRELELPDGTFVAALNGAVDPAPLQEFWGSQVPWSPIVGVERSEGVDWYRHANGSCSTTQMVWRSDLRRYAAMTRVGHQGPAVTPAVGR